MEINQLPEIWQARWQSEKFHTPTKIQEKVFEPIIAGQSIVGVSPTGSGKTIAYLLPTMLNISANQGVQLVVITATQELAMQVTEVARPWAKGLGLKVQSLIGGANIKRQIEKLKQRPEIVVGTAGRINELNQQKKLKLHQVKTLILDEADQLLKSNQESALLSPILKAMDNQVQVLAFSASGTQLPEQFQQMYRLKLTLIDVTNEDTSKGEITHGYVIWPKRNRLDFLRRLGNIDQLSALVFFNRLSELGVMEDKLLYHHIPVASLASDQSAQLRKIALHAFSNHQAKLLLCTDIATRGLDIDDLSLVVNMDFVYDKKTYLHRSGRVGRMGRKGLVLTLLEEREVKEFQKFLAKQHLVAKEYLLYAGQLSNHKK